MSVKNKVKRLNKRIVELEKEIEKIKSESIPLEHNCCRLRIPKGNLEMMNHARLEVERSYEFSDSIDFTLKI